LGEKEGIQPLTGGCVLINGKTIALSVWRWQEKKREYLPKVERDK